MPGTQAIGQIPQPQSAREHTILEKVHDRMLKLESLATEGRLAALRFQDKMEGDQPHATPEPQDHPSGIVPAMEQMITNIEESLAEIMATLAKY